MWEVREHGAQGVEAGEGLRQEELVTCRRYRYEAVRLCEAVRPAPASAPHLE